MSGAAIAFVYGAPFVLVGVVMLALKLGAPWIARHRAKYLGDFCTCAARLPSCVCSNNGFCNPRGAGRGRSGRA